MRRSTIATFAGIFAVGLASPLLSGPETVAFPTDYASSFVNYLDVDRFDRKRVRKMYVNPEALAAAVAGEDLPDGTILIMEDHDAVLGAGEMPELDTEGRMTAQEAVGNIFVMEKNAAWETENGSWDYAWYLPDGSPRPEANFDGCFACHNNRAGGDYNFTFSPFVAGQSK